MSLNTLEEIDFHQLPVGTIFKIGFICNIFFWGLMGLFSGVMALFGEDTISIGGVPTYGFSGLIASILASVFFSVMGACILVAGGLVAGWASREFDFGKLTYRLSTTEARRKAAYQQAKKANPNAEKQRERPAPEGRLW